MSIAIYNNVKGEDARVLKMFDEPSWNNPVVRFLDASGKELIPRVAGDWSLKTLVARMVAAMRAAKQAPPKYLELLHRELSPKGREIATFAYG